MIGTGEHSGLFSGTMGDRIDKGEITPEEAIEKRYEQAGEDFKNTIARARQKHDPLFKKFAHEIALESLKKQWEVKAVSSENADVSLSWYIAAYKYSLKRLEEEL